MKSMLAQGCTRTFRGAERLDEHRSICEGKCRPKSCASFYVVLLVRTVALPSLGSLQISPTPDTVERFGASGRQVYLVNGQV